MSDEGAPRPGIPPRPPLPQQPLAQPPWQPPPATPGAAPQYQAWPTQAPPNAFAAPYAQPAARVFVDAPPPRRTATTGVIALVAAVLAVLTSVPAGLAAYRIGSGTGSSFESLESDTDLSFLAPVREWVLMAEVSFWVGTAFGIWAVVQGIVAAATGRGRVPGVIGIVTGTLGPVVFFATIAIALGLGVNAAL